MCDVLFVFLTFLQVAVLARVILSWVDPSPFPNSRLKEIVWTITEPILGPIRRVLPPVGMFDLSAIVALLVLSVLRQAAGSMCL
jgi:YggT family protein